MRPAERFLPATLRAPVPFHDFHRPIPYETIYSLFIRRLATWNSVDLILISGRLGLLKSGNQTVLPIPLSNLKGGAG